LHRRSGDRALCASRRHGTKVGWRERRGCSNKEGLFAEKERETGFFAADSGSEKVVGERESFREWRGGSIKWV